MEDKIYEVNEFIGSGVFGGYFRLNEYPQLGVKILRNNNFKEIKVEFKKGKILRKLGISVPRYIGIIKVKISQKNVNKLNNSISSSNQFHPGYYNSNIIYYGLVIEYIDNDFKLTEKEKYTEMLPFLEIEFKKIKNLKIIPADCEPTRNILYNLKKQKFYFIDIAQWKIPLKYYLKYMFI